MSLCGLLQVKIRFADTQRQPGEKTRLIIKAAQGSKVAITAVDRSVHLLEEGNELSEADVSLLDESCYSERIGTPVVYSTKYPC